MDWSQKVDEQRVTRNLADTPMEPAVDFHQYRLIGRTMHGVILVQQTPEFRQFGICRPQGALGRAIGLDELSSF
jgi:hypothetical protein